MHSAKWLRSAVRHRLINTVWVSERERDRQSERNRKRKRERHKPASPVLSISLISLLHLHFQPGPGPAVQINEHRQPAVAKRCLSLLPHHWLCLPSVWSLSPALVSSALGLQDFNWLLTSLSQVLILYGTCVSLSGGPNLMRNMENIGSVQFGALYPWRVL